MSHLTIKSVQQAPSARPAEAVRELVVPDTTQEARFEPPRAATEEQIKAIAEQIESYLKASWRELQFEVDGQSGRVVVRVRDPATGDVIRQIPGEEVLRLARALHADSQQKAPLLLDLTI
jgi:flagellar protein FlaG